MIFAIVGSTDGTIRCQISSFRRCGGGSPVAHDVFISYSSKDKVIADAVCARLEARSIRCWIAPRDVQPGLPYGEEIIDAIHNSRAMVLVLSANANASPHIPKEVERAVSRGVPVIPLRVEDVMPAKSLDYFISSVHWLDAITPPLEQHLDSLANTIQTLLPANQPHRPQPLPPEPHPAPTPIVSARPASKSKWLLSGVAAALAILLLAAGYFIWGRPASPESRAQPGDVTPFPVPTKPASPGGTPVSGDPLVGCWHWFNNVTVTVNPDGTMIAGPFTAHWRVTDSARRIYHFTWPEAVDSVALSPDGRTLTGGNQYGFRMSATRLSPGPEISGFWRWYNGVVVTISPDGRFTVGNISGRWQSTPQGGYALSWPDPVDTVTLSSDHQRLSGSNQYGVHVSGTKMTACGGS
jgi:TIR domain